MSEKTEKTEKKNAAPAVSGGQDKKPVPVLAGKKPETLYNAAELAENAEKLFGCRPECVRAALKGAGKTAATVREAEETVRKFLKKEVR